jgi:hypothetical protein
MRNGIVLGVVVGSVIGCGGTGPGGLFGPSSGGPPAEEPDSGSSSSGSGGSSSSGAGTLDAGVTMGSGTDAATPPVEAGPTSMPDAGSPCYSEPYDPGANIADVATSFTASGDWLTASLTTMQRRYPTGYFVLNAEQSDPQLPEFVDSSSWEALMSSLMTMLDVETGGWDFDSATATMHPFVITDTLQIQVQQLTTWQQGEILQYITDSSTQTWDQTELDGEEGTYDGIFLLDDLDSACNGLAAATAVGDQITSDIWARDDEAAHLYYLELFLHDGRLNHPSAYAAIQADPTWQKIVRYEWARGYFWDGQAQSNPNLQLAVAPIWANIDEPANLAEIQLFTGEAPADVACHP